MLRAVGPKLMTGQTILNGAHVVPSIKVIPFSGNVKPVVLFFGQVGQKSTDRQINLIQKLRCFGRNIKHRSPLSRMTPA